jgi:hypothetical protein
MLLVCLAVALGMPGCAAEGDRTVDPEGITATEDVGLSNAEGVAGDDTAGTADDEIPGAVPNTRCLPPPYGVPVPISHEPAFYACMSSCQRAGHPYSACHTHCCQEVTQCSFCYIQ